MLFNLRTNPGAAPWTWKILLSGYAPQYAYDMDRLDTSLPFPELDIVRTSTRARTPPTGTLASPSGFARAFPCRDHDDASADPARGRSGDRGRNICSGWWVVLSALALDPSGTVKNNDVTDAFDDGVMVLATGHARTEPSDDFLPFLRQRRPLGLEREDAIEMHYDAAVTSWLNATVDL